MTTFAFSTQIFAPDHFVLDFLRVVIYYEYVRRHWRLAVPARKRPSMATNLIAITGDTYPVKDQLKALGARWNPDQKAWMVSPERGEEARKIVSGASKTNHSYHPHKCVVCGVVSKPGYRGYPEPKILRNGECVDCYEERKMGY